MKARVTYTESITYIQTVDIDDHDYLQHFGSMVITPERVKEIITSGEMWEQELTEARTMRNSEVDYAECTVDEVELLIL